MKYFRYYTPPSSADLSGVKGGRDYETYSEYNYLRPGILPYIKARHFEKALELTSDYFHKCNVIDFGCADGIFLPSLAKYFGSVVGIDRNPEFIGIASNLVENQGMGNVKLICNDDLEIDDLGSELKDEEYHIVYLMEVLEHIGNKPDIYKSKTRFLRGVSSLICDGGLIVLSVPNMLGLPFLIQRIGLILFDLNREPVSLSELIRASLFNDTSRLEERWDEGHIGFNHRKLERCLEKDFRITEKKNDFFQIIYLLEDKGHG